MAVRADEYGDDEDEGSGEKADDAGDVATITTSNWDKVVKGSKYALVAFTAPWCGHCKSLKPHYAKAATALKSSNPDVVIGNVDATVETELGNKFGVQGYPTLKWFVDGELAGDYSGGRDTEAIIKWVKKKSGPPAIEAATVDAVTAAEKESSLIVVGYFTDKEGDAYKAFKSVASKSEDVVFVETTAEDVASHVGVAKDSVVAIKNFAGEDREVVKFSGELSADALTAFALGEKLPLSIEFSQENSDKIFNSGIKKQVLLWSKAADVAADSEYMKVFREVSKEFKGKLVFVTVNNEGDSAEPVTNFFGLKEAPSPSVVGFYMEKNKKYKLKEAFSAEALEAFAAGILDGTAVADYKSAPIPEDNKDGDVVVVVGKTVDSIVKDPKRDVLLEVYAPWCGHCKKLEPVYKKLAKRFKTVDSVVIAKMDGTENEHPDIEVKGFPTILFYPAGEEKTPITFDGGDRSLKALTKFIKKHAQVPYDLPKKGSDKDEPEAKGAKGSDKDEL